VFTLVVVTRGKGIGCPVTSARRRASLTDHMSLTVLGSLVRIVWRDLVQRLDAVVLEVESSGVLLTRCMSSSTMNLGRIST